MPLTPFHIAVAVHDLNAARHFYGELLGFPEGRSSPEWIDFDMFGHQFVVHLDTTLEVTDNIVNQVDGQAVPVPHCGVVLEIDDWEAFRQKIDGVIDNFIIAPYVRFKGETGEQRTMFFTDPSGNALEFKAFRDIQANLFAK